MDLYEIHKMWIVRDGEKLKEDFLEAAKAQESLNKELYSLDFDGTISTVIFKADALSKDPVETVKSAAKLMFTEVFGVVDQIEVTVGNKIVTLNKENIENNIGDLAKLFLGGMDVDTFLGSDEGTTTDFSVKISKGDVKDVEIKGLEAIFKMN